MNTMDKFRELEQLYCEQGNKLSDSEKHIIAAKILKLAKIRIREAFEDVAKQYISDR
jgi:hypothetical protein